MASPRVKKTQPAADLAMEKGLPINKEAEQFVLACAMLRPETVEAITARVALTDFALEQHRRIYEVIAELAKNGNSIDRVTVANRLAERNWLESVGGVTYLSSLDDGLPQVFTPESYVGILREKAIKRKLILTAQKIMTEAITDEQSAAELLQRSERAIGAIAADLTVDAGEMIGDYIRRSGAENLLRLTQGLKGISTGIPDLDRYTDGLRGGEIFIIGARPAAGKTALALQLAESIATENAANGVVAFFSLEMTQEPLVDRLITRASRLDPRILKRDGQTEAERYQRQSALNRLVELPLFIDDRPGLSMADVFRTVMTLKQIYGNVIAAFVDYIQIMAAPVLYGKKQRYQNENEKLTAICEDIQHFTKRAKDTAWVFCAQLRRPERGGPKRPSMEDFRGTGTIEQIAWRGLLIHNEEQPRREDLRGKRTLILDKNRLGPVGDIGTRFNGALSTFTQEDLATPGEEQA